MHLKHKRITLLLVLFCAGLLAFYFWPVPNMPFDRLYEKVDPAVGQSLQSFRSAHPLRQLQVDGVTWEYIATAEGQETIVFLHGMTGAYDIWWQQISALEDQYRLISVTYPPVQSLGELDKGLLAILEKEGVQEFHVVGTSLGGYLAQYLLSQHPERIRRAILSNTFPPNDLLAAQNRVSGALLPVLPEWLTLAVFRGNFKQGIYPTSGNDELTLAFLNEIGYGRTSKAQLLGRYYCVIEKFAPASPTIPLLIIESDNDPLVALTLREQLQAVYPEATVYTFADAGHFPYLNRDVAYTQIIAAFLSTP
ncbi:MAG: alpha/beta hydrolase [Anaerolinea sp.]|nr:alpha/beta hydrolase [Anaerolinea sp.]